MSQKLRESRAGNVTAGDISQLDERIRWALQAAAEKKAIDLTVRVTDVYIKGHWLIVHEHVSVPVDLDTGKPDLSSKP